MPSPDRSLPLNLQPSDRKSLRRKERGSKYVGHKSYQVFGKSSIANCVRLWRLLTFLNAQDLLHFLRELTFQGKAEQYHRFRFRPFFTCPSSCACCCCACFSSRACPSCCWTSSRTTSVTFPWTHNASDRKNATQRRMKQREIDHIWLDLEY